ncbi:MAG TPA: hypothetical protein ENN29_11620 [Candidatus Hydrogenedentes bacterium]|nr:hypothetical protein [Candidatus Hydrogenedentota bacterium]
MQMDRRGFLKNAAAGLAGAVLCGADRAVSEEQRYNVVILMSDEHNPKFTSLHGHPLLETPNLERLASRGTLFENGYCPSPLCMPSRSAFMSGRHVHDIQCYNNCNAIRQEHPSYGAVLREQGVHTVHAGKTDVYRPSPELGFSELLHYGDRKWPGDMNISRDPLTVRDDGHRRARGYGAREDAWAGDKSRVSEALKWLRSRDTASQQPFTLCVNISAPHFPHYNTPDLWERYAEGADLPRHGPEEASANHPYALDLRRHFTTGVFTEEHIRGLRRGYLGCVHFVDDVVGRFLDALDETGLAERTVFIYTSDHGEMLGKFGMWWKCSLYEDSARVPVLASGPGFERGRRVATPVNLHDVQASLFAATGSRRPDGWLGAPLQELQRAMSDRALFAEYHGHGVRGSAYMIRKGDWKLIWCAEAPHLLFNLAEDPEELNNLAEKAPATLRELEEHLLAVCDPALENERAAGFIQRQLAAGKTTQA